MSHRKTTPTDRVLSGVRTHVGDWYSRALCGDADPDAFTFMGLYPSAPEEQTLAVSARVYCSRCPVAAECERDAREERAHGVLRGGLVFPSGGRPYPIRAVAA